MKKYMLALIALITLGFTTPAYAYTILPDAYCEFVESGGDCKLIAYNGPEIHDACIPSQHKGTPVTSIDLEDGADKMSGTLYIPSTIEVIYKGSFKDSNINALMCEWDVYSDDLLIMEDAFSNCQKLSAINNFRSGMISSHAFENCTSLQKIGIYQMSYMEPYITDSSFYGCYNVNEIVFDGNYASGSDFIFPIRQFFENLYSGEYVFVNGAGTTVDPSTTEHITFTDSGTWYKQKKAIITVPDPEPVKKTVKKTVKVTSVKLNKTKVTLKKGKKVQLKATVKPTNATNKKVSWKSSNKKIATVDKNGKVTAKKNGKVTITCTTVNGKKVGKCKITVK